MDDAAFARASQTAIAQVNVCREPTGKNDGLWAAYNSTQERWVSGDESTRVDRTVH
jgi:hypothetical protein